MANDTRDQPWWGKKHKFWGGETFTAKDDAGLDKPRLGINDGDRFRVEKKAARRTLTPDYANNEGSLMDAQNQKNALNMEKVNPIKFVRAYSMMGTVRNPVTNVREPKELFLVERANGSVAITDDLDPKGGDDGTISVER